MPRLMTWRLCFCAESYIEAIFRMVNRPGETGDTQGVLLVGGVEQKSLIFGSPVPKKNRSYCRGF